jgi:hypothetical protein
MPFVLPKVQFEQVRGRNAPWGYSPKRGSESCKSQTVGLLSTRLWGIDKSVGTRPFRGRGVADESSQAATRLFFGAVNKKQRRRG